MGFDIDKMIESAKKGNTDELFNNISPADAQKIKNILSDKEATEKLLNSARAQKLMEMLKKGGIIGG